MAGIVRMTILANAAKARAELNGFADSTEKSVGKVRGTLGKVGKYAAAGAAFVGAAVIGIGASVTKSASNAQQSLGATETVFGKYADTVIKRSNDAARAVGLSANEYRELSNVTGAGLKGAGVPLEQVSKITGDLNKRAADLAATFGGKTSDAVSAFSSLLRGEADPIERYGISVKQSDVNARLAAQGQDKLTGSALKQAEMMARLDLAFAQSKDSQGAFARESGTLAHQQQVLGAQFENIKAKVGTALLPVLTGFFAFVNDRVIPTVERLLPGLKAWGSEMGDRLAPIVSKVSAFVTGTLVPAIISLAGYVTGTVVPAVVAFATKVGTNLRPVLDAVVGVVQRVIQRFREWQPTIQNVISVVVPLIARVVEFAAKILGVVLPPVIRFAGFLTGTFVGSLISGAGAVAGVIAKVVAFGGAVIDGAQKVGQFASKVGQKIADVVGFFTSLPGKITGALSGAGTMLVQTGKNIVSGLVSGLESAKQWVIDKIAEIADIIPDWIARKLGIASPSKVTTYLGRMVGQGLADGIESMRGKVTKNAVKMAEKAIEAIRSKIDKATGVRDSITSLRDSIAGALTGDLFGGTGDDESSALDKFRAGLEAARATAEKVRDATKALIAKGVSKSFLEKLSASGNTDLIVQLGQSTDAAALADSYEQVLRVNAESGQLVAEEVIGTRLDAVNTNLTTLATDLLAAQETLRQERKAERAADKAERQAEREADKAERGKDREKGQRIHIEIDSHGVDQLSRGRGYKADIRAFESAGGR